MGEPSYVKTAKTKHLRNSFCRGLPPFFRLAAARSRSGSDNRSGCHSLPSRRFATSRKGAHLAELFELQITIFLALLSIKVSVTEVGLWLPPSGRGALADTHRNQSQRAPIGELGEPAAVKIAKMQGICSRNASPFGRGGTRSVTERGFTLAHFRREAAGALRGHRPSSPPMHKVHITAKSASTSNNRITSQGEGHPSPCLNTKP